MTALIIAVPARYTRSMCARKRPPRSEIDTRGIDEYRSMSPIYCSLPCEIILVQHTVGVENPRDRSLCGVVQIFRRVQTYFSLNSQEMWIATEIEC